jgi:hypothetical protein
MDLDDEIERKKLEALDLTDDVIEIILAKKRLQRQKKMLLNPEPVVEPIKEPEPTYYPPQSQPEPVLEIPDIIPEAEILQPISISIPKHILPWNRKKYTQRI